MKGNYLGFFFLLIAGSVISGTAHVEQEGNDLPPTPPPPHYSARTAFWEITPLAWFTEDVGLWLEICFVHCWDAGMETQRELVISWHEQHQE